MLISAVHGILLGALLFFVPETTLASYGTYELNQLHFDLSRHLGIISFILGFTLLLNRNSGNTQLVRTLLLSIGALNLAGGLFDLKEIASGTGMDALVEIVVRVVLGAIQIWVGWKLK